MIEVDEKNKDHDGMWIWTRQFNGLKNDRG